jgi:C4-dicarboxylate-specific signal transduction histidine kinase
MGEVATGMAHELNQPLSAIVNFASGCSRRMQSGMGVTGELVAAMGHITTQAQRASEIIRRLRAMVGHQPAIRESADINHLVREVCTFVEFDAGRQGVDIELELHQQPLPVRVDLVQVEQVLLNLLRNALDALQDTPAGQRRIWLRTRPLAQDVEVEIEDTGPGIDALTAAHLFDPFFTTKDSGMGMGLPISKTIMEQHRGSIRLVSGDTAGARFQVRLPREPGA